MKRLLLAVPALAVFAIGQEPAKPGTAAPARAQRPAGAPQGQPDQATLKKNRDEKLAKDFLKKADWHTDFAKAKAQAKKDGKLVFTYFSRSYAA
jgi:hypothetical protein